MTLGTGMPGPCLLGSSLERWSLRAFPGHQDNEQHFLAPPRNVPGTPTCPHPHPACLFLGWLEGPVWLCDFGLLTTRL